MGDYLKILSVSGGFCFKTGAQKTCLHVDKALERHSNGSHKNLQKKGRPIVFVKKKAFKVKQSFSF